MNWRRSSSSGVVRVGKLVSEKCSRHSWSSWTSLSNSAWKSSTGSFVPLSLAGSRWRSAGGSLGSPASRVFSASLVLLLVDLHLGQRHFLEHDILLELLLHQRLQFQRRRLEERQGLLELRRQDQGLGQALRQMYALSHASIVNSRVAKTSRTCRWTAFDSAT